MRHREDRATAVADRADEETPFPRFTNTTPTTLTPPASGRRSAATDAPDRGTLAESSLDRQFDAVLTSALFDEALVPSRRPANAGAAPIEHSPLIDTSPKGGGGGAGGQDAAGGGSGGNGGAPARGGEIPHGNAAVAASNGARLAGTGNEGEPVASVSEFSSSESPVAIGDEYRLWTGIGTSVGGNVGDNDSVPAGSTFVVTSWPEVGDLQFSDDGSFSYTLQSDYHGGEDYFVYRLWSGGVSSTAWVRLDLSDDPPLAMDDEYLGALAGAAFTVSAAEGVLVNDIEYDDEPVTDATIVTGPTYGSVSLDPGGSFTYTADDDYYGWDSFTYVSSDGKNFSQPATVTIGVNAVRILLNGQDITNPLPPAELWVGNLAELVIRLDGEGGLENIRYNVQWSIPDWAVQNWVVDEPPTPRTATIDPLEGAELQSQAVGFHWVTDGLKQVSVTATITAKVTGRNINVQWNGTKTGNADVNRPEGTIATTKDQVRDYDYYNPPIPSHHEDLWGQSVVLVGDYHDKASKDDVIEGVRFLNFMTTEGAYQWVQVMHSHSSYATSPTGEVIKNVYEQNVLDGFYPYSHETSTADSPAQAFDPSWRYHTREDTFKMHLMFKAAGDPNAIWVSVAQVPWWWSYEADSTTGVTWEIRPSPIFEVEEAQYNEELPTWNGIHDP